MNPDELKMMPKSDCIISLGNSRPIYSKKIVYYTDPVFAKRANWALPEIPVLDIHTDVRSPITVSKAAFVSLMRWIVSIGRMLQTQKKSPVQSYPRLFRRIARRNISMN